MGQTFHSDRSVKLAEIDASAFDVANGIPQLDASVFLKLAQIIGNVPSLDANGKLVLTGASQIGTKATDLAALWDKTTKIVKADIDSGEFDVANKIPALDASIFLLLSQVVGNVPSLDANGKLVLTGTSQIGTKATDLAALWDKTTKIVKADIDSGEFDVANKIPALDASIFLLLSQVVGNVPSLDANGKLVLTGTSQIGTKATDLAALWDKTTKIVKADIASGEFNVASKIPALDASVFLLLSQVVGNVPSLDANGKLVLTGSSQIGTKATDLAALWDKTTKLVKADIASAEFNVADKLLQLNASAKCPQAQMPDVFTGLLQELRLRDSMQNIFGGKYNVSVLDLTSTDADLKGFYGGVTDGRYIYCIPNNNGSPSGKIARIDINDFSSVTVLDLTSTDADLKGFAGGATDGTYLYLVPNNNGVPFGKIARVLLSDFSTVTVLDATTIHANLKGFVGCAIDADWLYLIPNNSGVPSGMFARIKLSDFATIGVMDMSMYYGSLKGFKGAVLNGKYLYLIPNNTGSISGTIGRLELDDIITPSILDLTTTDADLKGFIGGVSDGKYLYCIPDNNGVPFGKVARVLLSDFTTVSVLDLTATDANLKGFFGGVIDGKYLYLFPNDNGSPFGKIARIDLDDFSTVSVFNITSKDADLKGFRGGVTDGRYLYAIPDNNGAIFGKVARIAIRNFGNKF